MLYLSRRNSLAQMHLFRNFIAWVCLEEQQGLIAVDRNLGEKPGELLIAPIQPSKGQYYL